MTSNTIGSFCSKLVDLYFSNKLNADLIAKDGTIFSRSQYQSITPKRIHLNKINENQWSMQEINLEKYKDDNELIKTLLEALTISFNQNQYLDAFFEACSISYPYFPNVKEFDNLIEQVDKKQPQAQQQQINNNINNNTTTQKQKNKRSSNFDLLLEKLNDSKNDEIENTILMFLKQYDPVSNASIYQNKDIFSNHLNIKKLVILAHCCTTFSHEDVKALVEKILLQIRRPLNSSPSKKNSNTISDILEFINNCYGIDKTQSNKSNMSQMLNNRMVAQAAGGVVDRTIHLKPI